MEAGGEKQNASCELSLKTEITDDAFRQEMNLYGSYMP